MDSIFRMDLVLEYADKLFLNEIYNSDFVPPYFRGMENDDWRRQLSSLFVITYFFGNILYFLIASFSYYFVFDKEKAFSHPKFLKNQVRREISAAVQSFFWMTWMTLPWFLGEVRGWSKLTKNVADSGGYIGIVLSMISFILFTDMCIYWVHRWLHHPLFYARIHKPHHKWLVPSPFASHAFHPVDGYLQSVPYHLYVFLFPMHRVVYLAMFVLVNIWSISIHDGEYLTKNPAINGAANHTIHHLYFNYNYGQYLTLWDRLGGTFRKPTEQCIEKTRIKPANQKSIDSSLVTQKEE